MAGESARESARRKRAKAERLQRSADLSEQGADGEATTAEALAALPTDSWTVVHDLRWPGRRFADIDHVVVGPPGVFVIDTKNWSGEITVHDGVLRQAGRARATAVAGAADAAAAVHALVPMLRRTAVFPVLCFVSDAPLSGRAGEVLVCSTADVVELLSSRRVVMSADEARAVAALLDAGTAPMDRPSPEVATTGSAAPALGRALDRPALRLAGLLLVLAVVALLLLEG